MIKLSKAQQKLIDEIKRIGYTNGYGQGWRTLGKLIDLGLVERSSEARSLDSATTPNGFVYSRSGYVLTEAGKAL